MRRGSGSDAAPAVGHRRRDHIARRCSAVPLRGWVGEADVDHRHQRRARWSLLTGDVQVWTLKRQHHGGKLDVFADGLGGPARGEGVPGSTTASGAAFVQPAAPTASFAAARLAYGGPPTVECSSMDWLRANRAQLSRLMRFRACWHLGTRSHRRPSRSPVGRVASAGTGRWSKNRLGQLAVAIDDDVLSPPTERTAVGASTLGTRWHTA